MSFIDTIKRAIEGKPVGFRMDEVMTGTHVFEAGRGPAGRLFMEFRVTWGPESLREFLDPGHAGFMRNELEGTVTIEGLCEDAPVRGTLELKYFSDHSIRYTFDFQVAGVPYRYEGEKVNIQPWNLPVSHTTCFGTLTEVATGRLVSRSVTHFRLATTPAFIKSLRAA